MIFLLYLFTSLTKISRRKGGKGKSYQIKYYITYINLIGITHYAIWISTSFFTSHYVHALIYLLDNFFFNVKLRRDKTYVVFHKRNRKSIWIQDTHQQYPHLLRIRWSLCIQTKSIKCTLYSQLFELCIPPGLSFCTNQAKAQR